MINPLTLSTKTQSEILHILREKIKPGRTTPIAEYEGYVNNNIGEGVKYIHTLHTQPGNRKTGVFYVKSVALEDLDLPISLSTLLDISRYADSPEKVSGYLLQLAGGEGVLGIKIHTNDKDKVREVHIAFAKAFLKSGSLRTTFHQIKSKYSSEKGTGKYSSEPLIKIGN